MTWSVAAAPARLLPPPTNHFSLATRAAGGILWTGYRIFLLQRARCAGLRSEREGESCSSPAASRPFVLIAVANAQRVTRLLRLGQPTPASSCDFSDDHDDHSDHDDRGARSLQLRHRTASANSTWFPLEKASQLDHGSLSDGALPLRIESEESSSAEEEDTVSQMRSMSSRGHRRRNRMFRLSGSDSGFEPGGSGSGTADSLCRPVLNLLDSHRTRSNWSGV